MKVSVVIATYGDSRWRDAAWDVAYPSVLDQGARDVEVVHLPTGTLAQARNHGVSQSKGDWLCFLDADDRLADGYLDAMRAVWDETFQGAESDPALLAPAVQYVHPDGSRSEPAIPNKGRWPDLNECVIGTLVPTTLFAFVGGFRELPSIEDYDLWLRCVKYGARIIHVPQAVYVATANPDGRNSDQSVYHELRREHAEVWRARSARPR